MSQDILDWKAYPMKRNKDDVRVQYQDYPRYDQCCDRCSMYVAPSSCTLVQGPIIGKGHCFLFEQKNK